MATRVRDFAERVLLGSTISDKLHDPGALRDVDPGPRWRGSAEPGRAPELSMSDHAEPFVRDVALADAGARGRALHFFANHELLALELMALALLRFVDAPPAFRRGLVATLRDEQRHLSMYLDRMRALGTELGDAALGGFFWRTMAELRDPAQFVAHMGLTFEQANLDYASHYLKIFEAHGDHETARVIEAVYEDEVRHVGFGLHWFERWRPDAPLLAAHGEALVAPVTLRRARGRGFDREGRRRAGFPDDYLEAIANLPSARGRPPTVHLFDPTTELELGHPQGFNPNAATRARVRDLETLPLLFARPDDVVLVRQRPREEFLTALRRAGVKLAEIVVADLDGPTIDARGLGALARVQPWGWTPRLARRLAPLRARASDDPVPPQGWPPELLAKARGVSVLRRLLPGERLSQVETIGVLAHEVGAVVDAIEQFRGAGYATVACKASWGTAGRGTIRVLAGPIPEPQRAWIRRTLARQGAIVVEPWLDRVCDLSLRLTIKSPGRARIDGVGRVLVDPRGQYLGAVIGRPTAGLPTDLARFLHGDGRDPKWLSEVWRRVADEVARELEASRYVGTVGVDALVHRVEDGSLRLRPVVELNPRVHMGHVAVHLERLVAKGSVGLWRILRRDQVRDDLPAIEMSAQGIRHGVLLTNDPALAEVVVGVLAVARTLAEAEALLGEATGGGPFF
ncbi:hypothetical protein ENSA5_13570 [Enhygromyxa salina]|uniref:ATP-grasp domain-containing protein n=1 Tax=Enhygromyxa salina TaxID=215803 RepID=A0A2S9YEW3_9BACT|nr:DUF455 family protein [Enhygromyxa salina]PRQ03664.1 hypothetical protein ENSA5_13570 [Enhygromyxa salina]